MKVARIFLFLSPVLLLFPPLFPMHQNLGFTMLGGFYGTILRHFPWNLALAFVCYSYAQYLGREAGMWAGFSFIFPFIVPLVLAFMPPRWNSPAERMKKGESGTATGAVGAFGDRFPMLESLLAARPPEERAKLIERFAPFPANYEFRLVMNPDAMGRIVQEAEARKFALLTDHVGDVTYLYGAGLVQPEDIEQMGAWLRGASVSGEKIMANWRQKDGMLKLLEYYSV
jgi:hypothetical protein